MIPTVVLTGFLGAGKTTVLNALLARLDHRQVAVVENEVGEVGVDGALVAGAADVVEVTGGCACCTLRGHLAIALEHLARRGDELDALMVEASGVADPLPVVTAFAGQRAFRVTGVVCVVDVPAVAAADLVPHVWTRQLRFADAVVLAKADRAGADALCRAVARVREHAPDAPLVRRPSHEPAILDLLDDPGAPARAPVDAAPAGPAAEPGHGFGAIALRPAHPVDEGTLRRWLGSLGEHGVLRAKGDVASAGGRVSVQLAGGEVDLRPAAGVRHDRLVLIGHALSPQALQRGLDACADAASVA